MGCDIHWVIEARTKKSPWFGWLSSSNLFDLFESVRHGKLPDGVAKERRQTGYSLLFNSSIWQLKERDYNFFARLNGVRGHPTDKDPRTTEGIPDDLSVLSAYEIEGWGVDGHSHGHCSLLTFIGLKLSNEEQSKFVAEKLTNTADELDLFRKFGIEVRDDLEYRVVFWFDN